MSLFELEFPPNMALMDMPPLLLRGRWGRPVVRELSGGKSIPV
jgi:hypothetical protein